MKITPIGNIPNTELSWEQLVTEYHLADRHLVTATDYLLVRYNRSHIREVVAALDIGQLVALRATIDAIVEAAAQETEKAAIQSEVASED